MNIGPSVSVTSSAAGAPLSQGAGAESERLQKDAAAQSRQSDAETKAADAAGIGQTQQDQETAERDADGRRFWEAPPESQTTTDAELADEFDSQRISRDPTGESGNALDLTG